MENSQDRTVIDGSSSPDDRAGQEADGSSPDDRAWQEADGCEGTVPLQTTIAAMAYLICKEMLLSGEGCSNIKHVLENFFGGNLDTFFALILNGPDSKRRQAAISELLQQVVDDEQAAQIDLFNCLMLKVERSGHMAPSDEAYRFCIELLTSGQSFSNMKATLIDIVGRLPVLMDLLAHGPDPAFRINVLKGLLENAIESESRARIELIHALRAPVGVGDP